MKRLLLAGTAFLGLAASGLAARATPFDFTYTGSLVDFMVPATDTYQILAFGAQGGSGTFEGFVNSGGRGAETGGDFSLTAGEILQIAVGGAGDDNLGFMGGGGGGGGSFVVGPSDTPLLIAGGGGGGGVRPGGGGLVGPDGEGSAGGTNGNGGGSEGISLHAGGGGGGGFLTAGHGNFFCLDAGGGAFSDLIGGPLGGGFGGGGGTCGFMWARRWRGDTLTAGNCASPY